MTDEQTRTEPVTDGCVWCKKTEEEAAEDVEFVPVGEEEQLCTPCLGDLRWYKRAVSWQFVLHSDFPEEFKEAVFEDVSEAFNETVDEFGYEDVDTMHHRHTTSNAAGFGEYEVAND